MQDTVNLPDEFVYQGFIRQKIVARKKTGVISKPGSGKTRPIIDALVESGRIHTAEPDYLKFPLGPILIICSGPAIPTWTRQLPLWTNDSTIHRWIHVVRGTKSGRLLQWEAASAGWGIYITNYSVFRLDFEAIRHVKWAAIVADEYHKSMLRRGSQTYKCWRSLSRRVEVVVMCSGSALRKNPSSMFTLFHTLDPTLKLFRSYWRFVNTFCIVDEGPFGKIIEGPKNVAGFQKIMDRYLAYVPEEVVADNLPEGKRGPLLAEMTKEQARVYKELSDEMIAEVGDELIVAPNVLARLTKLRQLLCCPRILSSELDMGGGFEAIWDKIEDDDDHCVIFAPFRPGVDHVYAELQRRGKKHVFLLYGGVTPEQQAFDIMRFKEWRGILICTIAYAESFDLETCKTSYFLGYDFVLDFNEQAEGRTRRVISEHEFVTWNYVKYLNTIDEHFLSELGADLRNVQRVLKRPQEFINALKGIPS